MNSSFSRLALAGTLMLTFVCHANAGKLEDLINSYWPPINLAHQQWIGISSGTSSVDKIDTPSIVVSLDASVVTKEAEKLIAQNFPQLSNVKLTFDRQAARVEADFSLAAENGNLRVTGQVIGGASVQVRPDGLLILPAFESVLIKSATYKAVINLEPVITIANTALKQFLQNLNSVASKTKELQVPLRFSLSETLNVTELLSKSGPSEKLKGSGQITSYVHVRQMASLLDSTVVRLMLDVRPGAGDYLPSEASQVPQTVTQEIVAQQYYAYMQKFQNKVASLIEADHQDSPLWVAVQKSRVAELVNNSFHDVDLCVGGNNYTKKVHVPSVDINPFDNLPELNCSPQRNCSIDNQCAQNEDTRNCKTCLLRRPWDGGCVKEGNDPFCEGQKALQNKGYAVAYNYCKAKEAGEKFDCERIKATEKFGCEANKEWFKRLGNVGTIGDVSADVDAVGDFRVCLNSIKVDPALQSISIAAKVSADVRFQGNMRYTPKNLGHLVVCVSQWKENFAARATVPTQKIDLGSNLAGIVEKDTLIFKGSTNELTIQVDMRPSPFDAIFDQNPYLYINCVPAALLKLANISVKALKKEDLSPYLSGHIEQKIGSQDFSFRVEPRTIAIGEIAYTGVARLSNNALIYKLKPPSGGMPIPKTIIYAGHNGATYVNGLFEKKANGRWAERNEQSTQQFNFDVISETAKRIMLRDPSRKMLMEIDLVGKKMRWRTEATKDWVPIYNVISAIQ